ncbi:helix-turn-helix transcriptional regulator [bacterium]|nr:helix-turn-helix transcriptional regulator [bacterium]
MISKDLIGASAKPIILSILSKQESYGYEIIQQVKELSGGELEWKEGMLYPVLHRLNEQGIIESYWYAPKGKRKRKYYRLSTKGQVALKNEKHQWATVTKTLNKLWRITQCLT